METISKSSSWYNAIFHDIKVTYTTRDNRRRVKIYTGITYIREKSCRYSFGTVGNLARNSVLSFGMDGEYTFSETFSVTEEIRDSYNRIGFIIIRNFLDKEELALIKKALEESDSITKHAYELSDGVDRRSKMVLWRHPGNDITGIMARSEKLAGSIEKLLGHGEIYHWGSKLMMKEAKTGGRHLWHQDYGYWYQNGCLFPDHLTTAFIAYDRCNKENGCLQILKGSHKAGRIEHTFVGGQTGADVTRVEELMKVCPLQYVELQPGDALIFHSNLIHRSDKNDSEQRRWAFLISYNTKANSPVISTFAPAYVPLNKVPTSAIKSCSNFTDMTGKAFLDPKDDITVKADA
ncbi:phytanoyl-CoA dioxygenase domain-containing protein 1 homolog [Lingula anatina]|uniref:Phytanoyl-CoA dioxygenase domain-containing protein 1 homolog n=1 Tax=Lingula anatina TaxID=7574 RepID=A0A1S3JUX5_LINAN|nr:phytanoyl-CoA dioxygenase domain-containing protein 1 homolog [Lingula anatina]|eukprot:XP_013414175.1 phytanoyl-CoA dioxygenase domain-containing protein 1 homolog [Lingula anatina]